LSWAATDKGRISEPAANKEAINGEIGVDMVKTLVREVGVASGKIRLSHGHSSWG
jgi:hypothetical protein